MVYYAENMSVCLVGLSQVSYVICDYRLKRTRHPVCSAISKLQIARSVLRWMSMRESLVLQVLFWAPVKLCPPAAYLHVITLSSSPINLKILLEHRVSTSALSFARRVQDMTYKIISHT